MVSNGLFLVAVVLILSLTTDFHCDASQQREELNRIKKEIETHKRRLQETRKIESNLLQELQKLGREIAELERRIASQKDKIKQLQAKIVQTEHEINVHRQLLESRKNHLAKRIRLIQRLHRQPEPSLLILFAEDDLNRAIRQVKNLQKVMNIDRIVINQYRDELIRLTNQQKELQKLNLALKREEQELKEAEQSIQRKKREREQLLVKIQQERALHEKKIRELEENARRLSKLIEETERRERRAIIVEPKLPETDFTKRKGMLSWPVNGKVIASFGNQRDPVFNIPVFRSGIYIQASAGTSVRAVADGRVAYANYFKGYENLVIISHGDGYYTVYGNLATMNVREGHFVKTGQIIGTVSDKTSLETPALYFEIRYRGKPLNPEHWLRRQ